MKKENVASFFGHDTLKIMNCYTSWIRNNIKTHKDYYRTCSSKTKLMQSVFPELSRVRGHYIDPIDGPQPHWWLLDGYGEIVDPTVAQFNSGGKYEALDETQSHPTSKCPNCGEYCYENKSFCSEECRIDYTNYLNILA